MMMFGSCKKDKLFLGNTTLKISSDTVWFDTVFTRKPGSNYPISVTKIYSVKNTESRKVLVSFKLSGGKNSSYRINVDGIAGPEIKDLEIPAKDSVFVFVQCSLDANNTLNPVLIVDSLISTVNGKDQKTYLAAYGWDAHYYHSVQLPCNEIWSDKTKPFVIIDNALVASGCTFTIKPGVTVYNSPRSSLIVQGTLDIQGTAMESVKFTGDKPVYAAKYEPNQWGGIYFARGSVNNKIQFAEILNASIGIRVDSLPESGVWNLELENSQIMYCGQACVAGITAKIKAQNCLMAEAGSYSFLGLLGGTYDLRHCTFASYVTYSTRQNGHFAITNTLRDGDGIIIRTAPLSCNMYNSIVYGPQAEELFIDDKGSAGFTTDITNNLIRSKSKPFAGNTWNLEPLFENTKIHNYGLDTLSPAINTGIILSPPINSDLKGKPRVGLPDLGCFERQQ